MTRRSNRHDRHDAPLQRRAAARARSKCGGSAWPGGKALRLQRRAAPTHTAHAAVARKRSPARSCMMMSETPPRHPRPAGARSAPCTKRLDRRKAHDVFDNDMPTTKRQRARYVCHAQRTRAFFPAFRHFIYTDRALTESSSDKRPASKSWTNGLQNVLR